MSVAFESALGQQKLSQLSLQQLSELGIQPFFPKAATVRSQSELGLAAYSLQDLAFDNKFQYVSQLNIQDCLLSIQELSQLRRANFENKICLKEFCPSAIHNTPRTQHIPFGQGRGVIGSRNPDSTTGRHVFYHNDDPMYCGTAARGDFTSSQLYKDNEPFDVGTLKAPKDLQARESLDKSPCAGCRGSLIDPYSIFSTPYHTRSTPSGVQFLHSRAGRLSAFKSANKELFEGLVDTDTTVSKFVATVGYLQKIQ